MVIYLFFYFILCLFYYIINTDTLLEEFQISFFPFVELVRKKRNTNQFTNCRSTFLIIRVISPIQLLIMICT